MIELLAKLKAEVERIEAENKKLKSENAYLGGYIRGYAKGVRDAIPVDDSLSQMYKMVDTLSPKKPSEPEMQDTPAVGSFTDERDGKVYRTVKIGDQVWMAENLNYETPDSKVYGNDPANGEKYGRLYMWADARAACPVGWHLPTDAEWQTLVDYIGDTDTAGTKLKSKSGWYGNGNGTDEFSFSALPGGFGSSDDNSYDVDDAGYWWSATEYGASTAWRRYMGYSTEVVGRYDCSKIDLFSVRCVQD